MSERPIVIKRPRGTGGRRVRIDGQIAGLAYNLADVVEFLRIAGLDLDEQQVAESPLIDWDGAPATVWAESPP
jgi:hypothetical protein